MLQIIAILIVLNSLTVSATNTSWHKVMWLVNALTLFGVAYYWPGMGLPPTQDSTFIK